MGVRLALVQPAIGPDLEGNLERSLALLEAAAAGGAEVVTFPELQLCPFFPQFERRDASPWVLRIDDPAVAALRRKCAELGISAFPNLYLREGEECYDASVAIGPDGSLLGVSKMVHVVRAPRFFEQDYYTPSEDGLRVYETPAGRIGVVICFDRHYPESFRSCALRGAWLVLVPTVNAHGEPLELFEWEMRVAAMQNGLYVAMCNRIGVEHAMHFAGGSLVADPDGEVVARAGSEEEVLVVELDPRALERSRAARPYLALRRPEAFEVG